MDAAIFPALPEVFIVGFYFELTIAWAWTPGVAAVLLLVLALVGDLSGNLALYAIVRAYRKRDKTPGIIQRTMQKWTSFLAVKDERLILVNRIAPAVPLTGAFIAVCGWDLKRSLGYVVLGGLAKYALLLGVAAVLGVTLDPETARWVTLVAVVVLVGASLVAGQVRRKRMLGAT